MIIENEIEFSILQAALDCGYITDSLKSVINQSITNYNEYESSINPIIIAVCTEFGTNPGALKSHIRKREIVWSRYVIMDYLYSQRIGTLSMIGALFGLKYTTVIHAQKRIEEMRRFDKEFAAKYERIMKKISEINNNLKLYVMEIKGYCSELIKMIERSQEELGIDDCQSMLYQFDSIIQFAIEMNIEGESLIDKICIVDNC